MEWQKILNRARTIKEIFDRSHKSLNTDRTTKEETVQRHLDILIDCLEQTRVLFNVHYSRFTLAQKAAADNFFLDIRERLVSVALRKNIVLEIPTSIHEKIFLAPREDPKNSKDLKMAQTVVDFLSTASRLICDFDGKPENLRTFLDSLQLVDSLKGTHEQVAVSLIKTKLKGTARNLINNESSIDKIINKLTSSVRGESVEVISAKIMSIKQNNKTANVYCSEIESLAKSLESAYISDGLSCDLANKYSTQVAVKALTKNCNIDKVKLIMEAAQFNSMNDAVAKFVNSCTEATGQQNAILYYNRKPYKNNYRGRRGGFRGRGNFSRNNNSNERNNNNNNSTYNNRNRRGRGNNHRNGNHVRATNSNESDSENPNTPLR